ncbi:MAG TPA: DUF5684 domain-containing protein [Verrucomicrobiae bacterium]|nr:DUF5684 domain-containing protein [Verrucomicrobiae bacterium]
MEETFDVLQIGTHMYSNVTVTTKAKGYIFILHSTGMTNIRVDDLSPEVRRKLGYESPEQKAAASATATWAKKTIASLEKPQVQGIQTQLKDWAEKLSPGTLKVPQLNTRVLVIAVMLALALHFFFSYCCLLICQKAGGQPGILVFVPFLQGIPMLRAAGMSPWWLLAFCVPILNLVASVLWCIKIVHARQKNGWLALLLLLPVTSLFAFLYLAFSDAAAPEQPEAAKVPQIMTLETA